MTKEELIEVLQEIPDGTLIKIVDVGQNLYSMASSVEGTFDGIYDDFEFVYFPPDQPDGEEIEPFGAFIFDSGEYEDEIDFTLN